MFGSPGSRSGRGRLAANEWQAETGIDSLRVMSSQAVSQSMAANARPFANIAGRNGGFEVWQAGTSISVAASSVQYTADGWYLLAGANQASTISRQTGNTNGSRYSCRVQRNSGQTGTVVYVFGFPLDVDELKKMAGRSAILSFNVSTGSNWSPASGALTYLIYTGTGSPVKQYTGSYTATSTPLIGTVALGQGAAAATIFLPIAAIAANIGQAEIQFNWTPVGTAGPNDWFQIDDLSLSVIPTGISAIKPAFERSDFLWDLQRCQKHYEQSYDYGTAPGTVTNNGAVSQRLSGVPTRIFLNAPFKQTKRVIPTMTGYSPNTGASGFVYDNIGDVAINTFVVGTQSASIQSNAPTGSDGYMQWTADATI